MEYFDDNIFSSSRKNEQKYRNLRFQTVTILSNHVLVNNSFVWPTKLDNVVDFIYIETSVIILHVESDQVMLLKYLC